MTKVGSGDFEIRSNLKSKDEIGRLSSQLNKMIQGLGERFRLGKYVSKTTEKYIKGSEDSTKVGKKDNIVILFSDIRGFTPYSEAHDPEVIINTLNKILQAQAHEVEKHGGDIDKFIGDEIMAIFDDEYNAILCAYEMIRCVIEVDKVLNSGLRVGIGINSGEVVSGIIGTENRREFAVIGDTINLGARLCSIAKSSTVLISESVYLKSKDIIKAELVPNQMIKGKKESINFYILHSLLRKKPLE
jgi:adenylate cyclase